MNYKKLIRSRDLRLKILSLLDWIPDRIMIPLQYRIHTGRKLNIHNPKRFTEKIQLYKLTCHNPDMLRCTDKYEVRQFVAEQGLESLLIPLIGVYDSANEIDFDNLPPKFVAKTSDGGGGNQVLICRNKKDLQKQAFLSTVNSWLASPKPKKQAGREWAYENGYPRKVIVEELLEDGKHRDIPDYKFWCFNGSPRYCQVIGSRSEKESIDFFDMGWKPQPFRGLNKVCDNAPVVPEKPETFEEMKRIASILSKRFLFVRVDLYCANHKTYFGELTFYPAGGYGHFTPDSYDFEMGTYLDVEAI